MCTVFIKPGADASKIVVSTPYHPDFSREVRRLNGKWEPVTRTWVFDARDTERVKEVCRDLFGTDGTGAERLVTVRATSGDSRLQYSQTGAYVLGRCVAFATGRDSGARLGKDVVLISGRIGSGGSVKDWCTVIHPNTVVEIRDIPEAALGLDTKGWLIEVVPDQCADPKAALRAERGRLVARIAEIDAELS